MTKVQSKQMQETWALYRLNGWLEDAFEGNEIVVYCEKELTALDTVVMDCAKQAREGR